MVYSEKQISNIAVNAAAHAGLRYSLGCEYDGARYHVWIDCATGEPDNRTLYKNPPIGTNVGDAGYFKTRKLDLDGATGRLLYPAMVAARDTQDLVRKSQEANRALAEQERLRAQKAVELQRMRDAAPELVRTLRTIAKGKTAQGRAAQAALDAAGIAQADDVEGAGPALSPTMRRMLENIAGGRRPTDGLVGRSAHGGASGTYSALNRRKLLLDGVITPAGLESIGRRSAPGA